MSERIPYSLPPAELEAVVRVSAALGKVPNDVVSEACMQWHDAMDQRLLVPRARPAVPKDHEHIYAIVVWWLRRRPAIDILTPEKLLDEVREAQRTGERAKERTALLLLGRVIRDRLHPSSKEAFDVIVMLSSEQAKEATKREQV